MMNRVEKKVATDFATAQQNKKDPTCDDLLKTLQKALKDEGLEMVQEIRVPMNDTMQKLGLLPKTQVPQGGNPAANPLAPPPVTGSIRPIVRTNQLGLSGRATFTSGGWEFNATGTYSINNPLSVVGISGGTGSIGTPNASWGVGVTLTFKPRVNP